MGDEKNRKKNFVPMIGIFSFQQTFRYINWCGCRSGCRSGCGCGCRSGCRFSCGCRCIYKNYYC